MGFLVGIGVNQLVYIPNGYKETTMGHQSDAPRRSRMKHGIGAVLRQLDKGRVLGVALLLLALFSTTTAIAQLRAQSRLNDRQAALVRCLTNYSNGFADALDARTKATNAQQAAFDKFINKIADPNLRPGEFRVALDEYQAARAKQLAALADNPYPPAPRKICEGQ